MTVAKKGDVVAIDYVVRTGDGRVVGGTEQNGPQTLTIGKSEIFPQIEDALREKGKLEIRYLSAYNDETTTRVIEPLEISVSKLNTYVHAFCHLRKQRCTFRLDRILDIKTLS